ncbi:MAG: ABC transporter permease [Bacillus sp. (in: firmicutes)]
MAIYILKRLSSAVPLLFIIAIIIFSIIHLIPGDPAIAILGGDALPEDIQRLREQMGLNLPLIQQFLYWSLGIIKGDLGWSIFNDMPVTEVIFGRIGPTASLALYSLVIAIFISIPLGIIAATKRGTIVDRLIVGSSLVGMSAPPFLVGLFLMIIFGVWMKWFPVAGYQPMSAGLWNHIRYLTLPALALGLILSNLILRMTRSSMLDVINSNYIKAANSRGITPFRVIIKHSFRNAFLPILTVIGMSVATLFGGAVIIETVFNIPEAM